jgi:hypothetical protein
MLLFENTIFKINFNFKLSYLLIPLIYFLYNYLHNTRKYILYHIVCIGIIGTIDCFYSYNENNIGIGTVFISAIIHLLLLIVLSDFTKYGKINIISLVLLFFANLIILFLPYWPYSIKRKTTIILYNTIYIIQFIFYIFLNKRIK